MRNKNLSKIIAALLVLIITILLSLSIGSIKVPISDILAILAKQEVPEISKIIINDIRLPRILLAIIVGASLATSGALLQTVVGNPLADPGLTGVTSGAATMVLVIILALPQYTTMIPLAAFIGGSLTATIVYLLAWQKSGIKPINIIMSGIAINALCGGIIGGLSLKFSDKLPAAIQWMNGSLASKTINTVQLILPYAVIALILTFLSLKSANILRLGENIAENLGQNISHTRIALSCVAVILAAISVSAIGILGFVGLIVPHIARLLVGTNHFTMIPMCMILGALLVLASDTIGRTILSPTEIPAGIIMAFIGAPYFLYLMRRKVIL